MNSLSREKIDKDGDLRLDCLDPDGILSFVGGSLPLGNRYKYIFPN